MVPGLVGDTFEFDGVDDYVEVPPIDASLDLATFTVSAWIEIDPAASADTFHMIVAKGDTSSGGGGFNFGYDDRGLSTPRWPGLTHDALRFTVLGGYRSISSAWLSGASPGAGVYHVAGTFDGSVARLYFDGQLVSVGAPLTGVLFNTFPLRIGAAHLKEAFGIDDRFEGLIDEVMLHDRALNDAEVLLIAQAVSGACHDTDADSVVDDHDACPGTAAGRPVTADGCDGWQYVEQVCGTSADYNALGPDLACAFRASTAAVNQGLMTLQERGKFLGEVASGQ